MDVKKVLWITFGFVLIGIITVAIVTLTNGQIKEMNEHVPVFPQTQKISG